MLRPVTAFMIVLGSALAHPVLATQGTVAPVKVSTELTDPIQQAVDKLQAVPGAYPAVSAVIVQGNAAPWIHIRGRLKADQAAEADADTLFYMASQTKSFMGLLGAVLDRKGVLPLDTTLSGIWPQLRLPAPADPHRITMADLLSHQEGLTTDTLNNVTAYVRDIPAAEYPHWLETETSTRDPGFRYANLGDLIYGAALETRTGRNWHDWLDAEVLQPLRLDHGITSRPSRMSPGRFAWNHQWDGKAWHALAPKPDALMHAAGGLFASGKAMATWMQANLGSAGAGGALEPSDFARAQQPVAVAHMSDGQINCDGYSLGWYSCSYKGQQALMHPGSYVGTVSVTVLVPSAHAGLALVVNSDSAMEGFELEVMKAFIGLATGQDGEAARLDAVVAAFPSRLAKTVDKRARAMAGSRADPSWGGWSWTPGKEELEACSGTFRNALFGPMIVGTASGEVTADIGARHLVLKPARPGLFAATDGTLEPVEPVTCHPDDGTIEWRHRVFRR